jgi:hypothetical protein
MFFAIMLVRISCRYCVRSVLFSDAVVQFGPVQRTLCLNLGLDLKGPVQQVRFR